MCIYNIYMATQCWKTSELQDNEDSAFVDNAYLFQKADIDFLKSFLLRSGQGGIERHYKSFRMDR